MKIRAAVEAAKESGILILARTDCRPTQGIDEAVARIEMYVREGADILFLDSPADDDGDPSRGCRCRWASVVCRAVPRCAAGDAVAEPGRGTWLQDRHISDGYAVAGDGGHQGWTGGFGCRGSGGVERVASGGVAGDPGVCGLRFAGQTFYCGRVVPTLLGLLPRQTCNRSQSAFCRLRSTRQWYVRSRVASPTATAQRDDRRSYVYLRSLARLSVNCSPMPDTHYQNDEHVVAKGIYHAPIPYAKAVIPVRHRLHVGCLVWVFGKLEKGALDTTPCSRVEPIKLPLSTGPEGQAPRHILVRSWYRRGIK